MNSRIISSLVVAVLLIAGCKKDNYDKPTSILNGRVVYNKQALGLRSNGVQLELWQHGYELFTKIPVYINADGAFSAILFDGAYKLVRRQGNGPWLNNTDSIDVNVNGETSIDVDVTPYYLVQNVTYTKNGNTLTAQVDIQMVNNSLPLEAVTLYIGNTGIVDQVNNIASASGQTTITVNLPAGASFARIGVKTAGIAEQVYSQAEKIQ